MRSILVLVLVGTCFVGCGKVQKWRADRNARNEKIVAGINSRRAYLEKYLSQDSVRSIPEAFYSYDGFRDWWRMPLVFPYQLLCVDTKERACLEKYDARYPVEDPNKSASQLLHGICRLRTDNKLLMFEWKEGDNLKYGLLVYASGSQSTFGDERSMWEAAGTVGFSGRPQLVLVEEMVSRYYAYEQSFVEPDGPANRSQPIRSETNRTSSAAASRR